MIDLGVWLINGTDCSEEGGSIKDRWSALQDTLQSAKVRPVSDSPYLERTTSLIAGNQGAKKLKQRPPGRIGGRVGQRMPKCIKGALTASQKFAIAIPERISALGQPSFISTKNSNSPNKDFTGSQG